MSQQPDCQIVVDRAMAELGRVDILVNNAGVSSAVPATRESVGDFTRVIDTNLNGCYWMAQACGRVMEPGSSIVNISSALALTTAAYSASKAGLLGLTRDLAQQWGSRKGIRVNALAPGFFPSEMTDEYLPGYLDDQLKRVPLARTGRAEELAAAAVFLAGAAGGYVTRPDDRGRWRHDDHVTVRVRCRVAFNCIHRYSSSRRSTCSAERLDGRAPAHRANASDGLTVGMRKE